MASEPPSSFGSHNPFRRKTTTTATPTNTITTPSTSAHTTSSSDFARALNSLGSARTDAAPPPTVTFAKPKPVKKVRVQSPPPSSPESAGAEHSYPKYPLPPRDEDDETSEEEEEDDDDGNDHDHDDDDINGEKEDPFLNEAPPLPEHALAGVGAERIDPPVQASQTQSPAYMGRGPPPNPFQKTLEDMERDAQEGGHGAGAGAGAAAEHASSPAGKSGMDVEAFKRLLLTGRGPAPPSPGGETGSLAETSSTSQQSLLENTNATQETPRTSHEMDPDDDEDDHDHDHNNHDHDGKRSMLNQHTPPPGPIPAPQRSSSSRRKKPPPPPATKHGKLIKMELKDKSRSAEMEGRSSVGFAATGPSPTSSPTDINKPLPPPPEDDHTARHSIFDKEAAGKLPELDIDPEADVAPSPRPPTPPNASHSSSTPVQSPPPSTLRRPMPPPRRAGHGRSESKSQADLPEDQATTPPRSSLESQRSRSSSIRLNTAAPTPPPPRRVAGHRQSPGVTSPVSATGTSPSFPFPTSPGGSDDAGPTSSLAAKPSVPPAPPPQRNTSLRKSASSASNRKGHGAVPPPPPPRVRGGSRGSADGAAGLSRSRSVDSVRHGVAPVAEEGEVVDGVDTAASDDAVRAMLADLDALQREVDAARAQAERGGGGGGGSGG